MSPKRKQQTTPQATPVWPYPDVVKMTAHPPSGQWKKKYQGRTYYFGSLNDPAAALKRWREEWPRITQGLPRETGPSRAAPTATLADACNEFLNAKVQAYDRRELAWRTYSNYRAVCRRMLDALGRTLPVGSIDRETGRTLLRALEPLGPTGRHNHVVMIRTIVRWIARETGADITLGEDFKGPPARMLREQRRKRHGQTFTPTELRLLYYASFADPMLRAMILLGINGGYSNSDLAMIRTAEVDLEEGWISQLRAKTGADREVALWTGTVDAIRAIHDPEREYLIVGPSGLPYHGRGRHDISRRFRRFADRLGIEGSFRWLRYSFATAAAETGDEHARRLTMGHVVDGVSERYVLEFPPERLIELSEHVRHWMFQT